MEVAARFLGSTGCQPVVRGSLPQTGLFLHGVDYIVCANCIWLAAKWYRLAACAPQSGLHRYGGFDRWVRVVTDEFEIFEPEIVDVFDGIGASHVQFPFVGRDTTRIARAAPFIISYFFLILIVAMSSARPERK